MENEGPPNAARRNVTSPRHRSGARTGRSTMRRQPRTNIRLGPRDTAHERQQREHLPNFKHHNGRSLWATELAHTTEQEHVFGDSIREQAIKYTRQEANTMTATSYLKKKTAAHHDQYTGKPGEECEKVTVRPGKPKRPYMKKPKPCERDHECGVSARDTSKRTRTRRMSGQQ